MSKIVLAISNHSNMIGGGEHSFIDLLYHMSSEWKSIALVPKTGELALKLQKKKIETQLIPLPSLRPWFIFEILSSLCGYLNVCKKYRPKLIYANGSRAAFYGDIIGRILGLPVVWHCRIAESDHYLDFILTRLCNHIIVNSHATAKRFNKNFVKKVSVVYNGLDLEWLKDKAIKKPSHISDKWKIILVVARASKWKRHDLVLSAFEQVAASYSDLHLVCLGGKDSLEPRWWSYLQKMTRLSSFSDRIHWIGQVDDVRPWYRAANILVLASENEPFGRVLVEAMACGVPIIATQSGGVPEIVRHDQDGILVAPGRADEIAEAIVNLLKNEKIRQKFLRAGITRAQIFSVHTHVAKMVGIFEKVKSSE